MKKLIKNFTFRKIALSAADLFIIAMAAVVANTFLMYSMKYLLQTIVLGIICCFFSLFFCGAYTKMWRYFNLEDYFSCIMGIIIGISASNIIYYVMTGRTMLKFAVVHAAWSIAGICLFRFIFRTIFIDLTEMGANDARKKRTLIVGGGLLSSTLLREIKKSASLEESAKIKSNIINPICIVDDDIRKIGKEIEGVKVIGKTSEIPEIVKKHNIEQIVFAITMCSEEERKRMLELCSETQLPLKILPALSTLIHDDEGPHLLKQIRDIKVEDLLGRDPINFDNQNIKNFISGKVCIVTGGGGSIGSELVRQIAKYNPKQIIIIDIYENNAYDIQQELRMEYGNSLNLVTLIASVRDYFRMNQIFEKYKPQIVFHAAAHKHVPLMEDSPMESIKNNIRGTFNTATLAQFHNVEKFVMISTDKAVNPTNVMGASKRCCEMIVQYLSQQHEGVTEFVTTRFGNVLGSNGSVIPLFKRQIEQGKPVTVTHPDIIRYFMTIPEAVNLVLEAASIAKGGEIFVLDMGNPVKILSLAEKLIRMYGKTPYEDVEIKFTGLRPGEKLKEELQAKGCVVQEDSVKFPTSVIKEALSNVPKEFTLYAPNEKYNMEFPNKEGKFYTRTCTGGLQYLPVEGEKRLVNLNDAAEWFHVINQLDQINFVALPSTCDETVPGEAIDVHTLETALNISEKHIWIQPYETENTKYLIEMCAEVAGGYDNLRKKPFVSFISCSVPVLKFKYMDAEIIYECAKAGIPVQPCALPTAGANTPATAQGTALAACADVLAQIVMLELLCPGLPVIATPLLFSLDMKTTYTLQSNTEITMGRLICMQLFEQVYHIPCHSYGTGTDSLLLDEQNMIERTSLIHAMALSDASVLGGAGQMETAKTISPLALILDNDIFEIAQRLRAGLEITDETMNFEELLEGDDEDGYLYSEHTLDHIHDAHRPEMFFKGFVNNQKDEDRTALERARAKFDEIKALPVNENLGEELRARVHNIVLRATEKLKAKNE